MLVFISGCTSASFKVPNQRFDSPQVSGKTLGGSLGAGFDNPTKIVTVKNIETTPPDSSGSEITLESQEFLNVLSNLVVSLRIGLGEKFEISNIGSAYRVKYQFLGPSRLNTTAGSWMGSVSIESIGNNISTGSSSSGNSAKISMKGYGGSVILGYALEKDLIFYGNLTQVNFSATTDITQVSPTGSFSYDGKGDQLNFSLGARKKTKTGFYGAFEWTYNKTTWESLNKELGTYGLIIGKNF